MGDSTSFHSEDDYTESDDDSGEYEPRHDPQTRDE